MRIFVLLSIFLFSFSSSYALPSFSADEVKIAGKTLAQVTNGDFVHPALSPDGNQLAYSRVIVENQMELTEIAVLDLKTGKTKVLLTPKASKKYAVYSAFVSEFKWLDNNRLLAIVPDGDVDYNELTFNVRLGKLLKTKASSGEDDLSSLSPDTKKAIGQIRLISPNMPEDVLRTAWDVNTYLEIPGRGYFIQTSYYRYDNSIRFYDFQNRKEVMVFELPDSNPPYPRLAGGFTFGDKVIFAVADNDIRMFEFDSSKTPPVSALMSKQLKSDILFGLEVKLKKPDKVLFLLAPYSTTSSLKSELWLYDKSGPRKTNDLADIQDVDIKDGKIAYCYWSGNKRNIVVKELLP